MLDTAYCDRVGNVVVDLDGVRVLDEVAIAVIAIASERIRQAHRQLILRGMSRRQERTMRRRGLLIPQPRTHEAAGTHRRTSAA
jgi:anti-anti-sigma regulatory factor